MRRTHAAAGLAVGFGLGAYSQLPLPEAFVIALITETAALIPDLDLKLKIKHRGLTHSLLALFVVTMLALWFGHPLLTAAVALGYASHLFLDMLTVYGIELLYPYHGRLKFMNLRTGGTMDAVLGAVALVAGLGALISMLRV